MFTFLSFPMKRKPINKYLYWTPRVLSIIFICFLALMSLDVFRNGLNFWQTVIALFMHNIPAIILTILLVISWKFEIVGAITFILAGLFYIILILLWGFQWFMIMWILQISGIAFLIGILFWINWIKKRNLS